VKGPLFILSGPSGAGKSTVIRRLLLAFPGCLRLSVSATTRAPRPGESDGVDYHFWTRDRFLKGIQQGAFLEWAEVHGQHHYGTLRSEVEPFREQGVGVILDIDVQGADQVRAQCRDAVSIFLRTSSLEALEQRLRKRGEPEASIQRRMDSARRELQRSGEYQHQVINDDLEKAVRQLKEIVVSCQLSVVSEDSDTPSSPTTDN
jgi:guanylate kinase